MTIVAVADHGAKGDGKTDDGPSLRAAISQAVEMSRAEPETTHVVAFERGKTYYVGPWDQRWETLPIINARDLVINGNGAELNVHRNNMAFGILNSERVTIRNFTIDYRPLPFTQGEVIEVDRNEGTFLWQVEEGYPAPVGTNFDHACFIEPAPSRRYTHDWMYIEDVIPIANGTRVFRIVPRDGRWRDVVKDNVAAKQRCWFHVREMSKEQYNARFVNDAQRRSVSSPAASIQLRGSHNCVIENIDHFSSPRMTLRTDGSNDLLIRNVRVIRRPGTTRLCAGNSDGFHGRSIRGPVIENCEFEALGDDSLGLGVMAHRVMEVEDSTHLKLRYTDIAWYPSWIAEGQTLVFWDQESGRELGEAKVIECRLDGHWSHVTLDKAVGNIKPMSEFAASDGRGPQRVTVAFQKPESPIVVRNCRFRTQLKVAMLLTGSIQLEDNVIENSSYGMNLFLFGGDSVNTIRRNRIASAWPFAVGIQTPYSANLAHAFTSSRLLVENNEIEINALGRRRIHQGLKVKPLHNLVLRNNTFRVAADVDPTTQAAVISRCESVVVEGNRFFDQRPQVNKGVLQVLGKPDGAEWIVHGNEFQTEREVRHVYDGERKD